MNLSLVNQATLMSVEKLNGVLDRDNVIMAVDVDLVEHSRQGCRFSAPRRPGDQDKAARLITKSFYDGWKHQCVERFYLVRNGPEDRSYSSSRIEDISSKSRNTLNTKGKINLQLLFKTMLLSICQHAVSQLLSVRRRKRGEFGQGLEMSVHTHLGGRISSQMQVGSPHFCHPF